MSPLCRHVRNQTCFLTSISSPTTALILQELTSAIHLSPSTSSVINRRRLSTTTTPGTTTEASSAASSPHIIYSECKYLNRVYTTHEVSIPLRRSGVSLFESNHLPANSPTEDRRFLGIIPTNQNRNENDDGILCVGVVDGHAGYKCAQAVKGRLLHYLSSAILSQQQQNSTTGVDRRLPDIESLCAQWTLPGDYSDSILVEDRHRQSLSSWFSSLPPSASASHSGDPHLLLDQVFQSAFEALDHRLIEDAIGIISNRMDRYDVDVIESVLSGACVLTVAIDGDQIVCANSGDCKAVLGQRTSTDSTSPWKAIPLTNEHNAENENEVRRILDAHPATEHSTILQGGRLFGSLLPLRSFGDMLFKLNRHQLTQLRQVFDVSSFMGKSHTPPYLSVTPEVTRKKLEPKKDKFLILATDGLWDFVSSQTAVEVIGHHLDSLQSQAPEPVFGKSVEDQHHHAVYKLAVNNGATRLLCHAVGQATSSASLPLFGQLNEMIRLAPDETRHNRDDIEVTVIYFD